MSPGDFACDPILDVEQFHQHLLLLGLTLTNQGAVAKTQVIQAPDYLGSKVIADARGVPHAVDAGGEDAVGQLRLIFRSKNKNDRNDAERLAKLLYLGETPTVHVPSLEVRTWRELINCRSQVIAKRTRAKNAVRALLRGAGVVPPKQPGLWTKKGLAWLRQLALPTLSQQLRRDLLLEEIETLIRQVRRIEQQLNRQAQHTPAVAQLRTIPGVGIRTAEAVAAFVDDPHRFRHAKAVGSYFGLVPCQDQSGDRNRLGHITREGAPVVRQLVAEAAWQALRRSPTVRAYFERVQRGDPQRKKIAVVATAHYLVRVMWALLKRGTVWEEKTALAS
jgi:transposase